MQWVKKNIVGKYYTIKNSISHQSQYQDIKESFAIFGNVRNNSAADLDPFAKVAIVMYHTLSSSDIFPVLLARFASIGWSTTSESIVLGLPDIA